MLSPISPEMAWPLAASPVVAAAAYILWKRLQSAAGAAAAVAGILIAVPRPAGGRPGESMMPAAYFLTFSAE
jgi:hypothetical protein